MFECEIRDGKEFLFKDEHGISEVMIRKDVRSIDRPGKKSCRVAVLVVEVRCPTCGQYQEMRVVGSVTPQVVRRSDIELR